MTPCESFLLAKIGSLKLKTVYVDNIFIAAKKKIYIYIYIYINKNDIFHNFKFHLCLMYI